MNNESQSDAIRSINDAFRTTLQGGTVMFTAGIMALGGKCQAKILKAIQSFDRFNADNDPWGEHDFGCVEIDGERIFFKIDYFDLTQAMHSKDPADASITERVMTIMLASEY